VFKNKINKIKQDLKSLSLKHFVCAAIKYLRKSESRLLKKPSLLTANA
jgi:hypothetical protein